MGLKPRNIVQAAEADLKRRGRNQERVPNESGYSKRLDAMEPYAFHRKHVRRATSAHELLMFALMDPTTAEATIKHNTKMIYGDGHLLLDAIKSTGG